jgi:AAA+ ATPase superfamily predicted ATPase
MAAKKPPHIYSREAEWQSLAAFASDSNPGATLGLVYGRRRQGKSLLLESLSEAVGGFYHMALEQDEALALRALGEDIGRYAGTPAPVSISNWEQGLGALLNLARDRSRLVVLDEFPYLVATSPELPSVLQRAFGPRSRLRAQSQARLILCGSAVSIMGRLLSGTAPLRGRAVLDLLVHPFNFRETAGFWDLEDNPEIAFRVHAILGGTPAYRDLIRADAPSSLRGFNAWVIRVMLSPASPLFREGRYLMAEEPGLADRALYHSILTAIAERSTRPGQIAAQLNRPTTAMSHPLNVLEDIRLVRREEDALRQRRPTYHIAEPVVRFYFSLMRHHLPRLERGQASDVWPTETQDTFSSQVLGPHFEEIARAWTSVYASRKTLGGPVGVVSSTVVQDPSARARHEVDVVALATRNQAKKKRVLALGEAKWRSRPMGVRELERLERIRKLLESRHDLDVAGTRYLLFSPAGFSPTLRERARDESVQLMDLDRIYAGE